MSNLSQPGSANMRSSFNRLVDHSRMFYRRRISLGRLASNLLSMAIGISLGILFVSLLLDPLQSYAAQAQPNLAPVAQRCPLKPRGVGVEREPAADFDQLWLAPTAAANHLSFAT